MKIRDILTQAHVLLDVKATTKNEVIDMMARFLSISCGLPNPDNLILKMMERENQMSTGIGLGIAIPHCHLEGMDRSCMVAARLAEGIDFDSLDEHPVRLVFMTASPTNTSANYSTILRTLSCILSNHLVREELLEVETAGDFIDVIVRAEDALT